MGDISGERKPKRVQRKRTKGWKMPDNTIYVGRPTLWGNPFTVEEYGLDRALSNYRSRLQDMLLVDAVSLLDLRGKDLACWCPIDKPCHADILLELANSEDVWAM